MDWRLTPSSGRSGVIVINFRKLVLPPIHSFISFSIYCEVLRTEPTLVYLTRKFLIELHVETPTRNIA